MPNSNKMNTQWSANLNANAVLFTMQQALNIYQHGLIEVIYRPFPLNKISGSNLTNKKNFMFGRVLLIWWILTHLEVELV